MFSFIKKHFDLIGYIALAIFFVILNYNLYINMDLLIDSDMASEMLYSKLLIENKNILLTNWYYSTVIEGLDIPLVFAPLFLLTNNWHTVRIVGIIVLDVLLYLSFYYVCKQLDIKHIPWLAFLIIGSISNEYFDFVIKGSYYIPYIVVSFIVLGLIFSLSKEQKQHKYVVLIVLSILSGISGLRQIAQCFACLFGTSVIVYIIYEYKNILKKEINTKKQTFLIMKSSLICMFSSFIGYLLNILVISKHYSFKSDWGIEIELSSLQRLKDIVYGWTTVFGYETNIIWTKIITILIILFVAFVFIKAIKRCKNNINLTYVLILSLVSTLLITGIFIFTNMNLQIRYFIQVIVYYVLLIGLCLNEIPFKIKNIFFILITIVVLVCTNYQLVKDVNNSTNNELIEIKDILLENESFEGYGSFWNANVMTELSDGKIDVWNFHNYEDDDEVDLNNLDKWLQKKEHFERTPKGKVFVIFTQAQNEKVNFERTMSEYIKYQGINRILYIFDDYNELYKNIIQ